MIEATKSKVQEVYTVANGYSADAEARPARPPEPPAPPAAALLALRRG